MKAALPADSRAKKAPPVLGGGGEPCTLCSKRVYPAERTTTASGRVYHKTCFVCTKCTRRLTPAQCCEDGVTGRLYCEAHYRQLAKAAGLAGVASGGVDAAAGVLVAKRKKRQAADGEGDAEVGVGSLVWVELTTDAIRRVLAPEATDADAESSAAAPPPPPPPPRPPPRFVEPFAQAEVVSVLADAFLVRRRGGDEEVEVAAALVWPADEVAEEDEGRTHADNLLLPQLNEPGLLHNVRRRFEGEGESEGEGASPQLRAVYTYTGSILLALNPFEKLPLYGTEQMRSYVGRPLGAVAPHTYAMAEEAYRCLLQTKSSQSLVVSGESGAGKTEANKQLMRYLAFRSKKGEQLTDLASTILQSNPVLEAFGNAKTARNDNSSRFGKFVKIAMSDTGEVPCWYSPPISKIPA